MASIHIDNNKLIIQETNNSNNISKGVIGLALLGIMVIATAPLIALLLGSISIQQALIGGIIIIILVATFWFIIRGYWELLWADEHIEIDITSKDFKYTLLDKRFTLVKETGTLKKIYLESSERMAPSMMKRTNTRFEDVLDEQVLDLKKETATESGLLIIESYKKKTVTNISLSPQEYNELMDNLTSITQ